MRTHRVKSPDGVGLHVVDVGDEDARAIVLIHGWSQHHLSWSKQLSSTLSAEFRVIAPDLRGHGASDKPLDPAAYDTSPPWAGDVAAILAALQIDRPILVGWSMGCWVVGDYLAVHGAAALAGVGFVGGRLTAGAHADPTIAATVKPDVKADGMYAQDQPTALKATLAFVRACAAGPLSKADMATMVGFNMLCPPEVRRAARLRDVDHRAVVGALTLPVFSVHGAADRVVPKRFHDELAAAAPPAHTELHVYPGSGHMPFWEEPHRFNADLAAFARRAFGEPS